MSKMIKVSLASLALFASSALAYDQPAVNLGATSFLDGGPPSGPGFYFQEYIQYYTADTLTYPLNSIPDPEINVWASLNQFIYQSDEELLAGGKWGLNLILPIVHIDSNTVPDNGGGVGDLNVGPYLQWDPIMGEKGPIFMHRIELTFILPTGKYDSNKALNPGSHFVSFNPYWSGTLFLGPKATVSTRVHYLWNGKNTDPNDFRAPGASDTQAGQAVHANFAANYEVVAKKLRLGINGYYLKQVTDSEADGSKVSGKEQVFAIGPGALVSISPDTHLFLNAYFESGAEYRPEGERYNIRLVHHF